MNVSNPIRRLCGLFLRGESGQKRCGRAGKARWDHGVERLEDRVAPAALTITFSGSTMNIVGDADANSVTINAVIGDATRFSISSPDAINGTAGPLLTPSGIQNIAIKLLGGNDDVVFSGSVTPIDLAGTLTVNGGDGGNLVTGTNLTVGKDVKITNGVGEDQTNLVNLAVEGSMTIKNGNGGSLVSIQRNVVGNSYIGGNLNILNGSGADTVSITDMNVGGNVTVNQGPAGDGGNAGLFRIFNLYNTEVRSAIKGNVSVSYINGNGQAWDGIWDMDIAGNVTINHGTGNFLTQFDGYKTTLPVAIHGNLTLRGSGVNHVTVGTQYNDTGMFVGRNLTYQGGGGDITLNKLRVLGSAKLVSTGGSPVIFGTDIDIEKSLSISREGNGNTTLTNLDVGGATKVRSSAGSGGLTINRNTPGFNTIGGPFTATNGEGVDIYSIVDTNVDGNITINSGKGVANIAGAFTFSNLQNTGVRSEIHGNCVVTFKDGSFLGESGIRDAEVTGNVVFNNGSGAFVTTFGDLVTALPVLVHGNVKLTGTGLNLVKIGDSHARMGLTVGKSFSITTGAANDVMKIYNLHVGGLTSLQMGDGENEVAIDDSSFSGKLNIVTGKDADLVKVDTLAGSARPSIFRQAVVVSTGAGSDYLVRVGGVDAHQAIVVWSTFKFFTGEGGDSSSGFALHEFFPFGGVVEFIGP